MKNQVTIYDIARHLNISKSTVSRALTGSSNISSDTRRNVLEMAEKMDYQRNILSINLIEKKTYTIGVLIPEFTSSFYPQVTVGIQQEAARLGYNVMISFSNNSYETEVHHSQMLLSSQVDGLLVAPSKETQDFEHIKKFIRRGIPVVFLNGGSDEMIAPKVIVNDYDAAFSLVAHLIKSGKRRIAHLSGPQNMVTSRKRLNGYLDALKQHDVPVCDELIIPYDSNAIKFFRNISGLLNIGTPADAIFAIDDQAAIQAIAAIKRLGLCIPKDVAVVGFGNFYGAEIVEPALTTVNQPGEEMGRAAMVLLMGMLKKNVSEWRAVTKSLMADLIIRDSA